MISVSQYLNPKYILIGNPSVGLIETVFDDKSTNKNWSFEILTLKD